MADDVGIPAAESYQQLKERLRYEQADKTKDDVIRETGGLDLDDLPKQDHNWIKRGIKVSCEGANHPHHSHFLIGRQS